MVSVPSAVVSLIRKTEPVNIRGGDFYIDFEFVSLGGFREDDLLIQRFPVEIAVRRLLGQVVIDTPIKYDKSIPELLAGIPRTGSTANFSWAVMRKVYGQEKETFGKTWDELRHLLHDADMEKDSYVPDARWAMRALIDLAHRDDTRAEEFGKGELRIDEQISRLQEQLVMEYDKDDESDDGQSVKDVDSLETQIAHVEAMKAMTGEEKRTR
ncbi:hypothetical protein HO133_000426 [Letharia lupina]|uniref:Uncharacterized protein n=1 Tax=Letharia lupina TaxID=560253 RepID=A0A8H6CHM0_9LECA|nr:uncharacterized protein HO133_000426 [Letharia lupina]KAF6223583.1 hypothetical protein HO133_000426 [Letharia lupina]